MIGNFLFYERKTQIFTIHPGGDLPPILANLAGNLGTLYWLPAGLVIAESVLFLFYRDYMSVSNRFLSVVGETGAWGTWGYNGEQLKYVKFV